MDENENRLLIEARALARRADEQARAIAEARATAERLDRQVRRTRLASRCLWCAMAVIGGLDIAVRGAYFEGAWFLCLPAALWLFDSLVLRRAEALVARRRAERGGDGRGE